MVTLGHHLYFVFRKLTHRTRPRVVFTCRFVERGHIGFTVRGARSPEPERQTVTQKTVGHADGSPATGRGIRQSAHDRVSDSSEYITPVVTVDQRFSNPGHAKEKRTTVKI